MADWLEAHEGAAEAALKELEGLRKENAKLAKRVGELEKQVEGAASAKAAGERWEKERRTVRQRVQRLADGLEKALG